MLFQSCQQRPPSLQGVLALCVLGLQQSDPTLVQAALSEMNKYKDPTKADIVAMKSLVMALQGDATAAKRMISKAIHQRPDDSGLWKVMSIHLLNYHGTSLSGSASRCAQKSAGNVTRLSTIVEILKKGAFFIRPLGLFPAPD